MVGDYVFKIAFNPARQLQVLCGFVWMGGLQKKVFMCFSLNLEGFTFELNCGMLFFQNAGTSKKQRLSTNCKSLYVSLKRLKTPKTASSSPGSTETSHNSAGISPVPPILSNTSPGILPCTSKSRDKPIQHTLDDHAVAMQSACKKYTYKKLSELVEPEKKINIYGVIHAIDKVKLFQNLAYIVCSY
jgi:hypothetical protein